MGKKKGGFLRKALNVVTDYGQTVAKVTARPTEFVTGKTIITPKYKTEAGAKLGRVSEKIQAVTIPIQAALLPPAASSTIKTVKQASAIIPAKIPLTTTEVTLPENITEVEILRTPPPQPKSNFVPLAIVAAIAIGAGVLYSATSHKTPSV